MNSWTPPAPRLLPQWRTALRDMMLSRDYMQGVSEAINLGQATMIPRVPGMGDVSLGAPASQILCGLEAQRLTHASLYYASGDMTALAKAAGAITPIERFSERRAPARAGFLMFGEPIGAYLDDHAGHPDDREVTIVAVSWSLWSTKDVALDHGRIEWFAQTSNGIQRVHDDYEGVWITFYARPVFGTDTMPLLWNNEIVLVDGMKFDPHPPDDSTQQWGQIVYTAWQLMAQTTGGSRLVDTDTIPRDRPGRRRDARDHIEGPGDVRVINVHSAHRPRPLTEHPEGGPGPREYSHRWPVRPHRRDHCMNPRHHTEGDCTHEDRIIPPHIKGPADKPLKLGQTVNLWDHHPDAEAAED